VWYRVPLLLMVFILVCAIHPGEAKESNDTPQPDVNAKTLHLLKRTTVKLRVVQPISSATARLGDHVDLEVAEDVKIDGTVIISKRGKAEGFVAQAMSGKLWGAGSVTVYVGSVLTRTGFRIPVYGSTTASAISGTATDSASKEVTIPQGVEITASTEIDIPLEAAFYRETESQRVSK
jgi:hypothetical protein